ncbi:MAG: carbonic anhydrase [Hyphomicrobiaceae bacterium]
MADDVAEMAAGHRRFKAARKSDQEFLTALAEGKQQPKMLWIGCADSRVDPAEILGTGLGDLFVVRNIANVVPCAGAGDDSVGAAIEYCLEHLGVDDIVVCGHTGCGGIAAVSRSVRPSEVHLDRWVGHARASARLIAAAGVPDDQRLDATVRANILFQRDNLLTYPSVGRALAEGRLRLHAWLYDMRSADMLGYDVASGDWLTLAELAGEARKVPT